MVLYYHLMVLLFFFSSRRRHTRYISVTGVQTCALPISILLPTGANDPRVNPMHSRKFAARLQAAQGGKGTVLLRTSATTGHGGGTPLDEIIELLTDQYAFIFHYLGVPVRSR